MNRVTLSGRVTAPRHQSRHGARYSRHRAAVMKRPAMHRAAPLLGVMPPGLCAARQRDSAFSAI